MLYFKYETVLKFYNPKTTSNLTFDLTHAYNLEDWIQSVCHFGGITERFCLKGHFLRKTADDKNHSKQPSMQI